MKSALLFLCCAGVWCQRRDRGREPGSGSTTDECVPYCQEGEDGDAWHYIKTGGDCTKTYGWDGGSRDKCCRLTKIDCFWFRTRQMCEQALLETLEDCLSCQRDFQDFGCPEFEDSADQSSHPSPSPSSESLFTEYIINGVDTQRNAYPWVVKLDVDGGLCGGVLIHSNYVLTAAHCGLNVSPNRVTAELLRHDLSLSAERDGAIICGVSDIINHPRYRSDSNHSHDVGIWRLSCSATNIDVAVLDDGSYFQDGTELTVVGWGTTSRGTAADILQEVDLDLSDCPSSYRESRTEFCAGREIGDLVYDSCNGDSGSPIFDSDENVVVGIVSWGPEDCGEPGEPGVYIRLSETDVMDFITEIVSVETSSGGRQTPDSIVTPNGNSGFEVETKVTCGSSVQGSTVAAENWVGVRAPDVLYRFDNPRNQLVTFDGCEPPEDIWMRVFNTDLSREVCACDECGCGGQPEILECNLAAGEYIFVVEGCDERQGSFEVDFICE